MTYTLAAGWSGGACPSRKLFVPKFAKSVRNFLQLLWTQIAALNLNFKNWGSFVPKFPPRASHKRHLHCVRRCIYRKSVLVVWRLEHVFDVSVFVV